MAGSEWRRSSKRYFLLLFGLCLLSACSARIETVTDERCRAMGDLMPICGFQMPEDLVLLPDRSGILVSEYGSMGEAAGRLSLLDLSDNSRHILYRGAENSAEDALDSTTSRPAIWGDASCHRSRSFSPHGIDLSQRPSGRWQLLAVNHAEQRESLEWFELRHRDGRWQLIWRGCVEATDDSVFNDVAASRDGFFVTRMMPRDRGVLSFADYFFKRRQGFVWHWTPRQGFVRVAGSEGVMPNGIAVDGEHLYINMYGEKVLKVFHRGSGEVVAALPVGNVDNSNWDVGREGRLLLASHQFSFLDMLHCMRDSAQNCAAPFRIIEVDSKTLTYRTLLQSDGQFFGSATAALRVGDALYIGSFAGQRILRAPVGYGVDHAHGNDQIINGVFIGDQ